ncbi:MAG: DNA polymerase III subunit delta' [Alkalibacterium gilvum]|uniref:DNA polymerase III subunit delta' n=1 Tax=Alkalibacterium TaxID=99906 RepID=UPI002647BEA2|nr:DNA polymerase III subunit delta' [Alkalibacterium sp.]MDN6294000.1 DNA polymerase III subunit delta' [Alkalibacterium sp.]MDN6295623.1 DNA polymerase III subunit delta' [Alkalibacterium sp.]MDN6398541.1 DNA polymerase III subunit delta' [Alkalibacterium sp.]MDN6728913.1 DNA polymerase III subunit delta' [Alkalibacterium sp.]
MSTKGAKQPEIQENFSKLIGKGTIQHAYLFEGAAGTGKSETALWLAQSLLCPNYSEGPCQTCHVCQRISSHQHPDVVEIEAEGLSIKINQIRELKQEITKSGMEGLKKLIVVKDVEKMTTQAANSLLKFLEEPDGDITIILTTTAKHRLLPTILSRVQLIHFPQLSKEQRIQTLLKEGLTQEQAAVLSQLTSDTNQAIELSENETLTSLIDAMWKWYTHLSKKDEQAFIYVHTDIMPLVKGKSEYHLALDLFLVILQDILNSQISKDYHVGYLKHQKTIHTEAERLSAGTLADLMEIILNGKKYLDRNVAAQGVFEQATLQMLAVMNKTI